MQVCNNLSNETSGYISNSYVYVSVCTVFLENMLKMKDSMMLLMWYVILTIISGMRLVLNLIDTTISDISDVLWCDSTCYTLYMQRKDSSTQYCLAKLCIIAGLYVNCMKSNDLTTLSSYSVCRTAMVGIPPMRPRGHGV